MGTTDLRGTPWLSFLRNVMQYSGSKKRVGELVGFWLLLALPGCSWLLLDPLGSSWLLLDPLGSSWLPLATPGPSWDLEVGGGVPT